MAISPSLAKFISSGVYRLTIDKSQVIVSTPATTRLIIGFSKKGPFNTVVFVQDSVFFRAIYGDIDTQLERKGSFFHRTVLMCLERGPVIVLNLLNLDDDLDKSDFQSISTAAWQANSTRVNAPVSAYFNKDKFWFSDPDALLSAAANTDNQSALENRLLNVANVGRKTISVITKRSDILGFDVIAKDYFAAGQIPEFMRETDFVSDYMIDVIVVEGDFSDYTALSLDPVFGPYFDERGLKKTYVDQFGFTRDGLDAFLSLNQVNVLGVYTGSLLADFVSKNQEQLFIPDIVNRETSKTGLLLSLDRTVYDNNPEDIAGDKVDLIGHTIESEAPAQLEFLSYFGNVAATAGYTGTTGIGTLIVGATAGLTNAQALLSASTALQAASGYTLGFYDTLSIYGPSATVPSGYTSAFGSATAFNAFVTNFNSTDSYVKAGVSGPSSSVNFAAVSSAVYSSTTDIFTVKIANTVETGVTGPTATAAGFMYILATGATPNGGTASVPYITELNFLFTSNGVLYAGQTNEVYQDNLSGVLTDGDGIIVAGSTYSFAEFTRQTTNNFSGATYSGAAAFGSQLPILSRFVNVDLVKAYTDEQLTTLDTITAQTSYTFRTLTGSVNESLQLWGGTAYPVPTNTVWFDNGSTGPLGLNGFNGKVKVGQYFVMNSGGTGGATAIDPTTGKSRLTRIVTVLEDVNPLSATYKKIKAVTVDPILLRLNGADYEVERYKTVLDFVERYRFHVLRGYTLRTAQMPDGTATRENEILDVMTDSGISNALADREVVNFRYIVDSFQGTIEPGTKVRLARLAARRENISVIANLPSVKQLRESTNPYFKFDSTKGFEARYIATGGNLDLNPTNLISMPGTNDGASFIYYYGPNILIRENGKTVSVPIAAAVSNLYIDKYALGLPYSIVAGPRRGVIYATGLVGAEYNFDLTDLDAIEPWGYNAAVPRKGLGLVVNANQTGQQTIKSALSQAHVRELNIFIQDGIADILKYYRWEFNTPQIRLEIKTLADGFMNQILADQGVYAFNNIIDSSNNTSEVIDQDMAILDTSYEPVRGMSKIIHRTTLYKTGTLTTGNFL